MTISFRNDQELQRRSEELYQMTSDMQKQRFHNEMEGLMKQTFDSNQQLQQNSLKTSSKGDVVILNTAQDFNNWYPPGQNPQFNQNASYSLNQSSLFNDSKFVPFEQNQQLNTQQSQEDQKQQTANFTNTPGVLPSNSVQIGLDQFTRGALMGQQQKPEQNVIQNQLIQQYEQVLQLMHQEIQKLLQQNQELTDKHQNLLYANRGGPQGNGFQNEASLQQIQIMVKEKEELIETLRQREHVIMQQRLEIDSLNSTIFELQSRLDSQSQQNNFKQQDASLKVRNDHLLERVKKLEKQLRDTEQNNFELEQMNKNLKRDLKHQSIINDQLQQEQKDINQKRDALDQTVQEAKNQICQYMIQQRQLNTVIESQQIEITNLANQKNQIEKLQEQVQYECDQLKDQLNEADGIKLGQFQLIERKEREIQNLRVMIRRFITVIQTHRDEFGDMADVNYENLFKDVSNTNLQFQLPQSSFQHLQKMPKQVKFDVDIGQPIKHKQARVGNENSIRGEDDYYGMVEKLAQYVRGAQTSVNTSAQPSYRQRSPPRSQPDFLTSDQPKSILKQSMQYDDQDQQQQPAISWVTQSQTNLHQNQQPPQNRPNVKGKSPERKPNVEGLKATLASLIEEKKNLEAQLRSGHSLKMTEDLKFDLDLANNNIKRVQEKIANAMGNP